MIKKKIGVLLLSLVFIIILSISCTPAGGEMSLIGSWTVKSTPMDSSFSITGGSMSLTSDDKFTITVEMTPTVFPFVMTKSVCSGRITNANAISKTITLDADVTEILDVTGVWDYVLSEKNLSFSNTDGTYTFTK